MSRWVAALGVVTVLALALSAPAAQPDPVKAKLDKARTAHDAELTAIEKSIVEALDKFETAARKNGDKKALDKIKAEQELFELTGTVPKSLPALLTQKATAAHKALDAAYATAVKEYTRANKDAEAAAVDKERAAHKDAPVLPRYFLIVNKNSELVIAAAKEKGDKGSGLLQAKNTGADNQLWLLVPGGTGDSYLLRNRASGYVAGLGGGRNPGDNLFLDTDNGATSRWVLERDGFHFLIRNVHSKLHVTLPEASKEVGARVFQWNKGADTPDHYRWNLVAAKPK
jgi:hypothetical protein